MRWAAWLAVLLYASPCSPPEDPPPVVGKMLALFETLRKAERDGSPLAIRLSETEINEYLAYSLVHTPRPGLASVRIKIFPHNYVSTFTVVDFDALEQWKPGAIPTLLRPLLSGRKSVWTDFRFRAEQRTLTFSVEKAYFQNLRLPSLLVEKLIQIMAARQPERYDTTKPIPLPYGLQRIWTEEHQIEMRK